jgi:hypothetical protein
MVSDKILVGYLDKGICPGEAKRVDAICPASRGRGRFFEKKSRPGESRRNPSFISSTFIPGPERRKGMRKIGAYAAALVLAVFSLTNVLADSASSLLFSRLPESDVNPDYVARAQVTVGSLYEKWQNGDFEPVGDEFTSEMKKGLSPELQRQSFEQIKSMFGDFRGMTFVEALTARFLLPRGTVYRFKGSYSGASEQPEIRVVFDSDGKISGLWIKLWKDEIQ